MRARMWVVAAALLVGLAGCGGEETPEAAPAPAAKSGAQAAVDAIAAKWPLPNPRDTTSGCKAKQGDTAPGCTSRVTTDAVTVTEFADEATAKDAVAKMLGEFQQAGRFILSWNGEQTATSKEARISMAAIAAGL